MKKSSEKKPRPHLPLDSSEDIFRKMGDFKKGLAPLGRIWARGIKPHDLRFHYWTTWFSRANGNATVMSRLCGYHRNHVRAIIGILRGSKKTYRFRVKWLSLARKYPKKPFADRVGLLYSAIGGRPTLSANENSGLVSLWFSGFPFKVLRAHYVLWASRKGISRKEVCRRFGFHPRTLHRIRFEAVKKNSRTARWLEPMKPSRADWYPKGLRGRPSMDVRGKK